MNSEVALFLLLLLLAFYFLPSIIAAGRRHYNAVAIFLLNLFLGWTLVGWVIALVWSATSSPHVEVKVVHEEANQVEKEAPTGKRRFCSYCGAAMTVDANFCPSCGAKRE